MKLCIKFSPFSLLLLSFLLLNIREVSAQTVNLEPGILDFGSISPGNSTLGQIQINNSTGFGIQYFVTITEQDSGFGNFTLLSAEFDTLSAGNSKPIDIEFSPDQAGTYNATLNVYVFEYDSTFTAQLTGTGASSILNVDPPEQLVDYTAGSTTFNITSNSSWGATDDADWLTVSPPDGFGDGILTAQYEENTSTETRVATITVFGDSAVRIVNVTQAGVPYFINITPPDQQVSNQPGSTTFDLSTNTIWTATDDADWLTVSPSGGSGSTILTAQYEENITTDQRIATITVNGNTMIQNATVTQSGASIILTVDPPNQQVSNVAGTTNFNVTSNTSWTVTENADWLIVSPESGAGSGILNAQYQENTSTSPREAIITVTASGEIRTVIVTQSGASVILTVDPPNQQVFNTAGTTTFNITSNTSWNVTDNADWLTVSPESGAGSGILNAQYQENTSPSPREAIITVRANGEIRTVIVTQSGAAVILTVEPPNQQVSSIAGTTNFNVTSNTSWIVTDNADWLIVSPESGTGSGILNVQYQENISTSPREAIITVTASGEIRTVIVIQAAAPFVLTVDPANQQVPNSSGVTTFNITSNTSWEVNYDAGWLTVTPVNGEGNNTLNVQYAENTTTNPRIAEIVITGGDIIRTVTVTQSAVPFILTVDPSNQPVTNASGSTSFNLTSNTFWELTVDVSWLRVSPVSGEGSATLNAQYEENTGTSDRTGNITVTGGGITRIVSVTQSGAPLILAVDPADQPVSNAPGTTEFTITSNTSWQVSDSAEWLTVTPLAGEGNNIINVQYEGNAAISSRMANITVTGGNLTRTVTVTQSPAAVTLVVSPPNRQVPNISGTAIFSVISNSNWTVTDNASWLTVTPLTGEGDDTLRAEYEENSNTEQREAIITITSGEIMVSVNVVQSPAGLFLNITPHERLVENTAGRAVFNVTSNTSWEANDDAEWLTVSPAAGHGNDSIVAEYFQNNSPEIRTANITVSAGDTSTILTVIQSAANLILTITPANHQVSDISGTTSFNIISNTNWQATDDADWLSVDPVNGEGNDTLSIQYDENTITDQRIAVITITSDTLVRTVTVTQSAAPFILTINPGDQQVSNISGNVSFNITSNTTWQVTDDADWLTINPESGQGNTIIAADYEENLSTIQRAATITITGGDISRTIIVTQAAAPFVLTVSPTDQEVFSTAGNTVFTIVSNTTWQVSDDSPWLIINELSGQGDGTLTVEYEENTSTAQRVAIITINGGDITRLVTVIQSAKLIIAVTIPEVVNTGENTTVNITPPEGFQPTTRFFYYRMGGKSVYDSIDISQSPDSSIIIPAAAVTERGIQYYVLYSNGSTTVSFPEIEPALHPASIQTNISEISYGNGNDLAFLPSRYQMISLPLSVSQPALSSVFEDDYSTYNPLLWRVFRWDASGQRYIEYSDIADSFEPGKSFWLITRDDNNFDINNSSSVQADSAITIRLLPGYNQIANPFAFPVALDNIQRPGLTESFWQWNPEDNDWSIAANTLDPWKGYFVFNGTDGEMDIRVLPVESSVSVPGKDNESQNDFFLVQIKSNIELSDIYDQQNYVGMNTSALEGYDKFDLHKPPSISNDLQLSILSGSEQYARNVFPVYEDGAYWNLKISTIHDDKKVFLEFEDNFAIPDNFNVWLLDLNDNSSIPVINRHASINMNNKNEKLFKLIIGTEEYAKNVSDGISLYPSEYQLFQNFPNPFNPETNIYFSIKEKSTVTLEIFDILGSKVTTLFSNELYDPGIQSIKWNGTNSYGLPAASGVYIYRLQANQYIADKKMILLR